MATVVTQLGPEDHGRPLSFDEYLSGDYQCGYHYELIDGRLYVSPEPNLQENLLERWIYLKLEYYSARHPNTINYVSNKARVFVPDRAETTVPEPDVTAFRNFPLERVFTGDANWEDLSPLLAVEVLTTADPHKDTVRNVELYSQVPSIKEYWIIDGRADTARPTMIVYRKYRGRWRTPIELQPGDTYTTRLLPGFELVIDPRR
jgi:Uma2 family endonuclease